MCPGAALQATVSYSSAVTFEALFSAPEARQEAAAREKQTRKKETITKPEACAFLVLKKTQKMLCFR